MNNALEVYFSINKIEDITKEKLRLILEYDQWTGDFTWLVKPSYRIQKGSKAGYIGTNGYYCIKINGIQCRAHRLAYVYMTDKWPADEVDHINRNKLDNRWCNLREANREVNMRNRSDNRMVTINGVTKCLNHHIKDLGLKSSSVYSRLKMGWSIEDALTKPFKVYK